jgi:formylglycine-generating enzyme required for sulfatase activity
LNKLLVGDPMPKTKNPLKVFLCHASADKPKVRELYRYLRRRGIRPWFDEVDLVGGQDWQIEIPKAIESSDAIITCLTKNSTDKEGYVQKEIKFALDKALKMPEGRIYLIPVRFEECEVPFSLSRYQWVDLFEQNGFQRLMKSLKTRATELERAVIQVPKVDESTPDFASMYNSSARGEKNFLDNGMIVGRENVSASTFQDKKILSKKIHPNDKRPGQKFNIQLLVAMIGAIATILAALIGSPIIASLINRTPEPTNVSTATVTLSTSGQVQIPIPATTTTATLMIIEIPTPFPIFVTDNKTAEMIFIPEGSFIMGYDKGTVAEDPQMKRFVDAFYIDKYETTNVLYRECVVAGVCKPPHKINSNTQSDYYENPQFNEYPVVNVDWYMASTYCGWRNARLPTEPEWEKAARGDDARVYPWGDQSNPSFANYYNAREDTTIVGSYEKGVSVYGVYDMAGNVREWVSSLFIEYPYKTNDGREDPDAKGPRVFRGGAWSSASVNEIRTSYRSGTDPSASFLSIGFRCASSINNHGVSLTLDETSEGSYLHVSAPDSQYELGPLPDGVYALSPDGKFLVYVSNSDGSVYAARIGDTSLYRLETLRNKFSALIDGEIPLFKISFSRSESYFITIREENFSQQITIQVPLSISN